MVSRQDLSLEELQAWGFDPEPEEEKIAELPKPVQRKTDVSQAEVSKLNAIHAKRKEAFEKELVGLESLAKTEAEYYIEHGKVKEGRQTRINYLATSHLAGLAREKLETKALTIVGVLNWFRDEDTALRSKITTYIHNYVSEKSDVQAKKYDRAANMLSESVIPHKVSIVQQLIKDYVEIYGEAEFGLSVEVVADEDEVVIMDLERMK